MPLRNQRCWLVGCLQRKRRQSDRKTILLVSERRTHGRLGRTVQGGCVHAGRPEAATQRAQSAEIDVGYKLQEKEALAATRAAKIKQLKGIRDELDKRFRLWRPCSRASARSQSGGPNEGPEVLAPRVEAAASLCSQRPQLRRPYKGGDSSSHFSPRARFQTLKHGFRFT